MRAFSLLEVLVAVTLVGLAIITLVGVYVGGLKLTAHSQDHTAAVDLARELLEEIRELPWNELPAQDAAFDGRGPTARQGTFSLAPYPARGRYSVVVETSNRGALKVVKVRVRWGADQRTQLATMLSKP